MLELTGASARFCDRLSRRAWLRVGALAPLGLSLPTLLASNRAHAAGEFGPGFGRAKRCLLIFMWGGPAHQDLWDMKPLAPADVRGEFRPIRSNVPGIHVCEHLAQFSQRMDRVALIRSVTHTDNNHSTAAHWMLTGRKHRLTAENFGASPDDAPHLGAVISKLAPAQAGLPTFVALPEVIATTAGAVVPGQFGGKLGKKFDPFRIDQHPDAADFRIETLALPEGLDAARVSSRRGLLGALNAAARRLDSPAAAAHSEFQRQAADLVAGSQAREAFRLEAESDAMRDRYGRGTFGQGLLLGRRLLEAGVKLVTVYWHRDKPGVDTTWDTHGQNFTQLKDRLIPQVDQPLSALLDDLGERGLLDDTLVVWLSEFGRTPKVNGNAGRDHWGPCNTIWFAGGGVPGGQVFGASDKHAAYPLDEPVGPADVAATIYYLLGIPPHDVIHDREERPLTIAEGRPLETVLAGRSPPPRDELPPAPEALVAGPPNAELLADQPLAYWRLLETEGTVAADLGAADVGSAVQNSSAGAAAAPGAHPGQYLGSLAAGDRRMEAVLDELGEGDFTAELCFRNTRGYGEAPVTGYVFSRAGAAAGGDQDRGEHLGIGGTYAVGGDKRGRLFVFNGIDTAEGAVTGRTQLPLNEWQHAVLVRQGETVTVYLNGAVDEPELHGPLARTFTTGRLLFATRSDGMFPLAGAVREAAIFRGALAKERIAAHYAGSKTALGAAK